MQLTDDPLYHSLFTQTLMMEQGLEIERNTRIMKKKSLKCASVNDECQKSTNLETFRDRQLDVEEYNASLNLGCNSDRIDWITEDRSHGN